MMGHLITLILSTYPQTPQLSVSLCEVWNLENRNVPTLLDILYFEWSVVINILLPGRLLIMLRQRQVLAGEAVDQRQSVILLDHSEPCNGFQWEVLEEVTRGGGCQSQGQEPGTSWYQLEQWACADSDDDQQPVTKGHDIELNSIGTCGLNRTKMNCVL